MLPQAKGSLIRIPAHDTALQRWAEWHGFVIASGTGQNYVMRRDFPDLAFAHYPEPKRPRFTQAVA